MHLYLSLLQGESAPHIILDMNMADGNGIVTVTQPQEGLPRLDDRLSCYLLIKYKLSVRGQARCDIGTDKSSALTAGRYSA